LAEVECIIAVGQAGKRASLYRHDNIGIEVDQNSSGTAGNDGWQALNPMSRDDAATLPFGGTFCLWITERKRTLAFW